MASAPDVLPPESTSTAPSVLTRQPISKEEQPLPSTASSDSEEEGPSPDLDRVFEDLPISPSTKGKRSQSAPQERNGKRIDKDIKASKSVRIASRPFFKHKPFCSWKRT